jgi:hypothetical protein
MADLNVANNPVASPVASPMVPAPIEPVYEQPNPVNPAPPVYEQPNPMNVPAPPVYEQPNPMNVPIEPVYEQPNPMNVPIEPVEPVYEQPIPVISEDINKTDDPKFKEKTEKFENLIMDLHEQYMNLPDKIGKYAYDKLVVNADRILSDYSDYITPNVDYMVENMKKKLEMLNPKGGIQQKGEKVFNKLKGYLKRFVSDSINFSQFKGNTKGLNEQFNIVLSKLIENLKTGTKDEITTLVELLHKLIEEMMKKHSVGKDLKPEDFLDKMKNLAMRPIQIIRGKKDGEDSEKPTVPSMGKSNEAGAEANVTFEKKSPKYNVGLDTQLKGAAKDNERDGKIAELKKQIEDAKKSRTETDTQRKHREKSYKENNYKHLKRRSNCTIEILKEKVSNFDKYKQNPDYIDKVKRIYHEIIDRISANLYSFDKEKRDDLENIKKEADELFKNFLNNVMKHAQKERDVTPQDCDDKGFQKWFDYNFTILKNLKTENKDDLFNHLYAEVLKKINADKAEIEKLPETDTKRAGKLKMVKDAIEKLNELKSETPTVTPGTSTKTLKETCNTALYGRKSPNEEVQQTCDIKNYSNDHKKSIEFIKQNKKIEDTIFVEKVATETLKVINGNRTNRDNFITVLGPVEDVLGFFIKYVSETDEDKAFKKFIVLSVEDATWSTDFNYDFINCSIHTGKKDDDDFSQLNSELPIVLLNVGEKSMLKDHDPHELLTKLPRVTQCEIEWIRQKIQDTTYKWETKKIEVDNKSVWIHILKSTGTPETPTGTPPTGTTRLAAETTSNEQQQPQQQQQQQQQPQQQQQQPQQPQQQQQSQTLSKKVGKYSPIEKCYSYHDVYCLLNLSKKNAK